MPVFTEDAALHRDGERGREGAAVPSLFKCKYLTSVNRYTINIDPLMGGRCFNVASGAKRSQGQIKKAMLIL